MKAKLLIPVLVSLLSGCPATPLSQSPLAGGNIPPNAQVQTSGIALGQGRLAELSLSKSGQTMSGKLIVRGADASLQQISRTIALGSYDLTGTFSLPRGFSMSGTFPPPVGAFTVSGLFPSPTLAGTATLSVNGETVTIPLPALNQLPTPESTLAPISSPVATASPLASAQPSASPAKNWTEAELEAIAACFNANFNPKDPPSIAAYASVNARLNAYKATRSEVSPEVHQSRLNTLGVDAIRLNHQYHFSCVSG